MIFAGQSCMFSCTEQSVCYGCDRMRQHVDEHFSESENDREGEGHCDPPHHEWLQG